MATKQRIVHSTLGIELVRKLSHEGITVFTIPQIREIADSLGLSYNYLCQALHYLVQTNWVIRLKKGLYSLSSNAIGVSPLHEFEVAMALVTPAAISHWSALNYHGLTEQVPRTIFVLTPAKNIPRVRKKNINNSSDYIINGITYQFVQIKPEYFFGIKDVWINDSKVKITDIERTMLDGLMAPQYCGGFMEVLHILEENLTKINIEKLIEYALKLDQATIKRLGYILTMLGIEPTLLKPLQIVPIKGFRVLDPTGQHIGKYDKNWMIQVNLTDTETKIL